MGVWGFKAFGAIVKTAFDHLRDRAYTIDKEPAGMTGTAHRPQHLNPNFIHPKEIGVSEHSRTQ